MKRICFLLFLVFTSYFLFSQGIVRGKVVDESGESLVGVIIYVKANKTFAAQTDLDGNYSIKVPDSQANTLVVTYVSYKSIEQVIPLLKKNDVFVKDFTMRTQNDLEEVVIVAKQVKANEYYMENIKKQSAVTMDYISSETMKKTGDQNVVAAVARVSGVSTGGGLITVRGIGDRYVKTTLNGSRIPTLDPLTNNIKLDIFPASLVDNVIITKTSSPDLPGDWAGAYLSIETKDYPDKLLVNIETQFGYNAQTTFKEFESSQRSTTDWLGYDTGLRNRSHEPLKTPTLSPSTYDEMVALGLSSYYNSLGITTAWDVNSPQGETYFKLGLVQLGLLAPALINDGAAYLKARQEYDATYKKQAFGKINPDGSNYNNGFANNWNTIKRRAPINFSQNFSVGNQTTLFNKPFGYFFGFRYGSFVRYDPNGVSQRVDGEALDYRYTIQDDALISRQANGWSSLLNLAYKLNDKNSISFLFMPNFAGTNDVANFTEMSDGTEAQPGRTAINQFYEQRRQLIYQVKSDHFLAGPKMKIDFNASYTKGNSIAPDFKITEYSFLRDNSNDSILQTEFGPSAGDGVKRFYRYLSDNVFDSRLSFEMPISKSPSAGVRKIKFGGAYQQNNREQDLYDYVVAPGNRTTPQVIAPGQNIIDASLSPDNFIMTNQEVGLYYQLNVPARNFTFGKSTISSVYAMVDYSLLSFLRVSGGLRVEHATIFSDVVSYHNNGYKANDFRRENTGGYPLVNPANIDDVNFLPSVNVIFKLKETKRAQLNFRLNYSQTLARPSMRELNDAAIYDNEFRTNIYGNSDLVAAQIKNYDFRFESYFKNQDNISLSVFYKDFTNHIEMSFGSGGLSWNNVGKSKVSGIELEGKKALGKHFDVRANLTLVQSNSQVIRQSLDIVDGIKQYTPIDTVNRPMFGQAPYIVNGIFGYSNDSLGLIVTLSYNVQGPRLAITGLIPGLPDVYEMPRNTLDFKISKTLGKHFTVSVTIRDILNAPVRRAYKLPDRWEDYDNYRYGTNYLFALAYKL